MTEVGLGWSGLYLKITETIEMCIHRTFTIQS